MAVLVGTGARATNQRGNLCTHGNGLKRVTFVWMDNPAHAVDGKSRGTRGMATALRATVGREAYVVHDNWFATTAALNQLGYRQAPAVNHSTGFRTFEPGHND
eukprot:13882645-Alexandrium_andersonii.AAC.1